MQDLRKIINSFMIVLKRQSKAFYFIVAGICSLGFLSEIMFYDAELQAIFTVYPIILYILFSTLLMITAAYYLMREVSGEKISSIAGYLLCLGKVILAHLLIALISTAIMFILMQALGPMQSIPPMLYLVFFCVTIIIGAYLLRVALLLPSYFTKGNCSIQLALMASEKIKPVFFMFSAICLLAAKFSDFVFEAIWTRIPAGPLSKMLFKGLSFSIDIMALAACIIFLQACFEYVQENFQKLQENAE
ncbi:hypothetical protein [Polycladidibacter stylochi]|uniref:hypothetical protein n=1 Tax=Polycladidibacter stylochi TaxID=1807766 RepID=UPI00082BDFF5|nr:hypothetical protein [Pseudovibrio stylochi]